MIEPIAVPIPEAVRLSNLGRTTLYAKIKDGELPVIKVGRKTLISMSDLRALLASHTKVAA